MYFRLTCWISLEPKLQIHFHWISLPVRVPSNRVRGKRAPSLRTKSCFKGCCLFCKHLNHNLNHPVITCLLLPAKHAGDTVLRSILRKLMLEKQCTDLTITILNIQGVPVPSHWCYHEHPSPETVLASSQSSNITTLRPSPHRETQVEGPVLPEGWVPDCLGGLQWGVLCYFNLY